MAATNLAVRSGWSPRRWLVPATVLAVAIYAAAASQDYRLIPGRQGGDMHGSWSYDHTNIRKVVGISSNVFVGRIVAVSGRKGIPLSGPGNEEIPRTKFRVLVL